MVNILAALTHDESEEQSSRPLRAIIQIPQKQSHCAKSYSLTPYFGHAVFHTAIH